MAGNKPTAKGIPTNVDAERMILGAFLLDNDFLKGTDIPEEAFSLNIHRAIYRRMLEMRERNEVVDRITLANELMGTNELNQVGGLSYLVSLDDSMPSIPNVDSYARIVKEKHILRRLILLGQQAINAAMEDREKPLSLLRHLSQAIARLELDAGHRTPMMTPGEIIESLGGINTFAEAIDPGISWGYPQLDNYLLGMQRKCQYLIGGRTGCGKSALGVNIAFNMASRGEPVQILSMEMSKEALLIRAICSRANVPIKVVMLRKMMTDQRRAFQQAAGEMADLPVYIDDTAGMSITDCSRKITEAVVSKKIRAFVVDHMHRINWQAERAMRVKDEYTAFTAASWVFCTLARQHDLTSVVLVQLSRPSDKRKQDLPPTLADLRGTGALEQDATGVIFIHRPEQFKRGDPTLRGVAKIIVAKSRNGEEGECEFRFKSSITTFYDDGSPFEGMPQPPAEAA